MMHLLLLAFSLGAARVDSIRPDAEVREVALRHASEIQQCYELNGLRLNPSLSGTVEVEATVLASGRVDSVAVSRSELRGSGRQEVESCIATAVHNWRFDRGPFATEIVVYPFSLVKDPASLIRASNRS